MDNVHFLNVQLINNESSPTDYQAKILPISFFEVFNIIIYMFKNKKIGKILPLKRLPISTNNENIENYYNILKIQVKN